MDVCSMKKFKRKRIRLTKFGKIFFSAIALIIICSIFLFKNKNEGLFFNEETDKYTIEIEYPKLKNKNIATYTQNYLDGKKEEFVKEVNEYENLPEDFKYEFKTEYEIIENSNTSGVHLTVYEYTGGAHHNRLDRSYYVDNKEEVVTIKDFLLTDNSIDHLASIAYYYVMQYSNANNLGFDETMAKDGLTSDPTNFEHFNFTDKGLEFIFPPYQVAYYAAGEVRITIPYEELIDILKPEYIKNVKPSLMIPITKRNLEDFANKKLIAFTFDDGPSYKATNKLLDNLDKYDARVTFFVMGNRINEYADTLKRASSMGNLIGSHTYSHKNLLKLDNFAIIDEIRKTNDNIKKITNQDNIYLRPPYGNINSNIKKIANMHTILWDLDTEDWKYKDRTRISNYIVSHAHDGAIVLLHDLYESSVDGALDAMSVLKDEGYAFVTIEEMALIKNIELDYTSNYYNF